MGFSDDPILTSRFRMLLTGGWNDHRSTITMCYEQPEVGLLVTRCAHIEEPWAECLHLPDHCPNIPAQ